MQEIRTDFFLSACGDVCGAERPGSPRLLLFACSDLAGSVARGLPRLLADSWSPPHLPAGYLWGLECVPWVAGPLGPGVKVTPLPWATLP